MMMKYTKKTFVNTLSNVLTDLSAGWFALVFITPGIVPATSPVELFTNMFRSLVGGMSFFLLAMEFSKEAQS